MPQIVKTQSSGYSNTVVGFLVMVPNIVGLLMMILVSRMSDRELRAKHELAEEIVGQLARRHSTAVVLFHTRSRSASGWAQPITSVSTCFASAVQWLAAI
jgi:hypothetical protein